MGRKACFAVCDCLQCSTSLGNSGSTAGRFLHASSGPRCLISSVFNPCFIRGQELHFIRDETLKKKESDFIRGQELDFIRGQMAGVSALLLRTYRDNF